MWLFVVFLNMLTIIIKSQVKLNERHQYIINFLIYCTVCDLKPFHQTFRKNIWLKDLNDNDYIHKRYITKFISSLILIISGLKYGIDKIDTINARKYLMKWTKNNNYWYFFEHSSHILGYIWRRDKLRIEPEN